MAKKKIDESLEDAEIAENPSDEAEATAEAKQPMSLEDAIAAAEAELAVSEMEAEVAPKRKKSSKTEDDAADLLSGGTAAYDPALVMADIKEEEFSGTTATYVPEIVMADIKADSPDAEPVVIEAATVVEDEVNAPVAVEAEAPAVEAPVEAEAPIAEEAEVKAPKKKKSTKTAKAAPKADETAKEEEIAPPATEVTTEEVAPVKKGKKSKNSKKSEPVTESEEGEIPVEETDTKKSKKKPRDPGRNFFLLKFLIILLAILAAAISGHVYYHYIYDAATAFEWTKLIPIVPFGVQLLLLLLSLIVVGTSKRKSIGASITAAKTAAKVAAQETKMERAAKDLEENLLVPEVDITPRRTSELSNYQLDSFYKKNIEEINGKYYMQIAKFDDSMRAFNAMGATDMELVAVNMIGDAKFNEILDQERAKTLNTQELVSYFLSKPNTFAIKKRGAIDWTFKYSSKSFGIVREGDDSYKVSVKCFPDAAHKLNEKYKALEDSNFPSGPLWFCFNELRNLPPRVCKWLIDTSCQISKFQQIKTDKLKDAKSPADFDLNLEDIAAKWKAGEKMIIYPKYAIVFSTGDDADHSTYLTREIDGLDASGYTKEFYYKYDTERAISVLCPTKGVSEDVVICLFDNIGKYMK